jgi:hypothetical protein
MLSGKHGCGVMAFRIVFFRGSDELGSSPWPGDQASAEKHARSYLLIHKTSQNATSVKVFNDSGKVVFVDEVG